MGPFGFLRVACCSPHVRVANPRANRSVIEQIWNALPDVQVVLFPELAITGYTCADLFASSALVNSAREELIRLAAATANHDGLLVVGAPLEIGGALYNTGVVLSSGRIVAVVPKRFLPNYREFYEARWFRPASPETPSQVRIGEWLVPCGDDVLTEYGPATIGLEICEDLWTPIAPSSQQALSGANVLLNLSASNEVIGKSGWRSQLVSSQSGRCLAAYCYASAGPSESTTDLVFGGHCLIAENGHLLSEQRAVGSIGVGANRQMLVPQVDQHGNQLACHSLVIADVDLELLGHERLTQSSFVVAPGVVPTPYRRVPVSASNRIAASDWQLKRHIPTHPFVPSSTHDLEQRCGEILEIQVAGLTKRLTQLGTKSPLVIGVSGGLDSTLALLVACQAVDVLKQDRQRVIGFTLPGFGTTERTLAWSLQLMNGLGISVRQIDIRQLCLDAFIAMQHQPFGIDPRDLNVAQFQTALGKVHDDHGDLVFENTQARIRTMLLMNQGFVLGTGDLSEQALGWSTYNGDHMSMYNVNTSIPKTLVRFLVRYAADFLFRDSLGELLHAIADAPITPELLPLNAEGQLRQNTESTVGPYELHDFFLFYFVRYGFQREKILYLASQTPLRERYGIEQIEAAWTQFIGRFFRNQFKRSCVPDGPKVGTVSLSPRGDWRMPSDADGEIFRD